MNLSRNLRNAIAIVFPFVFVSTSVWIVNFTNGVKTQNFSIVYLLLSILSICGLVFIYINLFIVHDTKKQRLPLSIGIAILLVVLFLMKSNLLPFYFYSLVFSNISSFLPMIITAFALYIAAFFISTK